MHRATSIPVAILAVLLLLMHAWLCVSSLRQKSATYDEQVYVLAGWSYLETGNYSLKQDAPPLIPVLSGLVLKAYSNWSAEPLELSATCHDSHCRSNSPNLQS